MDNLTFDTVLQIANSGALVWIAVMFTTGKIISSKSLDDVTENIATKFAAKVEDAVYQGTLKANAENGKGKRKKE